jgi:hypothetical protein
MERISNETKAKEIAEKLSHPNIDSFGDGDDEVDTRFYHACKDAALEAMDWKKQQLIDKACNLMQHWILEHDYVDIFELEDYIKQQMEDDK